MKVSHAALQKSCPRQRGQPIQNPQSEAEHIWHVNRNRRPAWLEWSERGRRVARAEVRKVTGEPHYAL